MEEITHPHISKQKATILRERMFFAAFIIILFALAFNGALFLIDQGISILRGMNNWKEALLSFGFLFLGISVISITGLLLVSALQTLRLAWKLEKEGQVIAGSLLRKEHNQDGKKHFFSMTYCLNDDIHFVEGVTEVEYLRLNVSEPVNVRTLAGHPDIARLEK